MSTVENDRPVRSCKIRLNLTKEQVNDCWTKTKVSRSYWNLLVDIDRRNGQGEFDDILSKNEKASTYWSDYYKRNVYKLTHKDYFHLAQVIANENPEAYDWFYGKDLAFIKNTTIREYMEIRIKNKGRVKFRKHLETRPGFPVRCDISSDKKHLSRIYLKDDRYLQIPSVGQIRFGKVPKGIDLNDKKQTAQVNYDGKHWYLVFTEYYQPEILDVPYTDGIGIDVGLKTLAVASNGVELPSIKTFKRYRRLKKRLKILQRRVSKKYRLNNCNKYSKTNNIKKLEREIRILHRRIIHIRQNHILNFISKLIKLKPQYITLENLNVKGMLKNKHLARSVSEAGFYYFRSTLTWKAKLQGISVRLVDRFYPSSKLCSACGHRKEKLGLHERIYKCSECGLVLDRDVNAAYNLRDAIEYKLA